MTEPEAGPSAVAFDPRLFRAAEVVERPAGERPTHDTFEAIEDWLVGPALGNPTGGRAIDEFAWRMVAAGLPLLRMTLHSPALHPQFLGTFFLWGRDHGQTVQTLVAHEIRDTAIFQDNPVRRVIEHGETLRRRLDGGGDAKELQVLRDVLARGGTEVFALPVASAHGGRYAVTYTTDRAAGFSPPEIAAMTRVSRRLSVACDHYSQRALTSSLLDVYLGRKAGPAVLAGQIRRGTGEELNVVLWSSDLRGFTERSDRLPGHRMIAILNALFDAQAGAIHGHGGEILKFIGDGLLAIFPIGDAGLAGYAARNALEAAAEAQEAVRHVADDPLMQGEPPLKIVVALHVGIVIYGNVGAADRLDFTAIGPAVNLVSRAEAVAKALDRPIVVSGDFARAYGRAMRSLGHHSFRGLAAPCELFAPD